MNKQFIEMPNDRFERMILSAELINSISGKYPNRETFMGLVEAEKITLTKAQEEQIEKMYSTEQVN